MGRVRQAAGAGPRVASGRGWWSRSTGRSCAGTTGLLSDDAAVWHLHAHHRPVPYLPGRPPRPGNGAHPHGDYYLHLTDDLRRGTFGQPWKRNTDRLGARAARRRRGGPDRAARRADQAR
ncbi:DUF2716 domain-containing protein [Streptomyces gardneri]|uniref:DUF2716 domain-containing protein n=1 Tax=Streptomyces gardneri TaxID=66892 RepID=UPI00368B50CA